MPLLTILISHPPNYVFMTLSIATMKHCQTF